MYAKIQFNAGCTQTQVKDTVRKLLTGETDLSNLDGINVSASEIVSIIPAGWTVHDATASANSVVFKAPYVDAETTIEKYVEIGVTSATALIAYIYETWNSTNKTGTFKSTNSTSSAQVISTSAGFTLYICATSRYIFLRSGSGDGDGTGFTLCCEYNRLQTWQKIRNDYPYHTLIQGNTFGTSTSTNRKVHLCRAINRIGNELSTPSVYAYSVGINESGWGSMPSGADAKVPNGSGGFEVPIFPIYIGESAVYSSPIGEVSSVNDIYTGPRNLLAFGEVIMRGANAYIHFPTNTNNVALLIRRG